MKVGRASARAALKRRKLKHSALPTKSPAHRDWLDLSVNAVAAFSTFGACVIALSAQHSGERDTKKALDQVAQLLRVLDQETQNTRDLAIAAAQANNLAREDVKSGRDLALAAEGSLSVSHDALRQNSDLSARQSRAYLAVASVTFGEPKRGVPLTATISIENEGYSPAYNLTYQSFIGLAPIPLPIQLPPMEQLPADSTVSKERTLNTTSIPIPLDWAVEKYDKNELALVLVGQIDYKNLANKRHRLRFCRFNLKSMGSTSQTRPCPKWNEAT